MRDLRSLIFKLGQKPATVPNSTRMLSGLVGLLLVFGAATRVIAQIPGGSPTCAPLDLNAGNHSPLRKIPIEDQNGSGICYAEVASLLIDYQRALKKEDIRSDRTDPVYLAWIYSYQNEWIGESDLDGGYVSKNIQAAKAVGGVCRSDAVTEALERLKGDAQLSHPQLLKILDDLYANRVTLAPPSISHYASTQTVRKIYEQELWGISACKVDTVSQEILKESWSFKEAASPLILASLFESCQEDRRPIAGPTLYSHITGSDQDIQKALDQSLNLMFPVAISLCAETLSDSNYKGLSGTSLPIPRGSPLNRVGECSSHAVAVTARRPSSNGCQYLVRNSWGSQWRGQGATSCACYVRAPASAEGKLYVPDCPPWTADVIEVVGCWYPDKQLIPNMMGVEGKSP